MPLTILAAATPWVSADGYPTVQAAVDALGSGGGTVLLGASTYALPLEVPAGTPITLQGQGVDATVLHQASTSADGISGADVENLAIRDLTITGPGAYTGTGNGINLTVSGDAGNATFYVELSNVHVGQFGVDGVTIETPIVSRLSRVRSFQNGRHGIHLHTAGDLAGTSTHLEACFPAGNHGAGIRLDQQAYTTLNGCAADANGIGYDLDTCQGIVANGCGSEEPYDFSGFHTGYAGHSWRIFNSKATLNSPYAIGNVGTAYWVQNSSRVVVNSPYEGSPGNPDSPTNDPTASIKVDSGCSVTVANPALVTATSYADGTVTVIPDSLVTTSAASQQAVLGSDVAMTASSNNTLLSLTLGVGKWLLTGTVTLQQGAGAGNTDIRFVAGTATISGGTSSTIRAASASQPAAGALTAIVTVTVAGTVALAALPVAAATAKAATAANSIPAATTLQAVPLVA